MEDDRALWSPKNSPLAVWPEKPKIRFANPALATGRPASADHHQDGVQEGLTMAFDYEKARGSALAAFSTLLDAVPQGKRVKTIHWACHVELTCKYGLEAIKVLQKLADLPAEEYASSQEMVKQAMRELGRYWDV